MNSFLQSKILGLFVKTNGILSRPLLNGKGHIFLLHRVLPRSVRETYTFNKGLAVSLEYLEAKLAFLQKEHYRFISMDELYAFLCGNVKIKGKFAVVTLDDGYRDNLEYGMPLFKKYGVPFTIYVTNSFPDKTARLWWYWLEKLVNQNDSVHFRGETYHCKSQQNKESVYTLLRNKIKDSTPEELAVLIAEFFHKTADEVQREMVQLSLSWEEIRQIHDSELGCIGGHTQNHLRLSSLSDSELHSEIVDSKIHAERVIGSELSHFAYPYGGLDDTQPRVVEVVNAAGYNTAVVNYPGNIFKQTINSPYLMPRYPLGDSIGEQQFENYLNGVRHFSANGFSRTIQY